MVKIDTMSKNIVNIMKKISNHDILVELITNNNDTIRIIGLNPSAEEKSKMEARVNKARTNIMNPKSPECRISPVPFDTEATTKDCVDIRVYYNQADFNNDEIIKSLEIHIDVIVAKSLWLINNGSEPLIRPYEIVDRLVDLLGRRSVGNGIRLNFKGFQHLYINNKFDSIRLYAEYDSVEK